MSTIKANTLLHSDGTTTTQPSIPALDQRMAKAWVNFDGTGTIRSSYGFSSVTDLSTGSYTANFTTAEPNALYNAVASGGSTPLNPELNGFTTSGVWVIFKHIDTAVATDVTYGCITVFSN